MSVLEVWLTIFINSTFGIVILGFIGVLILYTLWWLFNHISGWIESGQPWWYYGREVDRENKIRKKIDKIHDEEWEL